MMVPANLKVDKLIVRHGREIKGFHKDKVYFICHSIYNQMNFLNDNMVYPGKHKEYYVPLSADILKARLGNMYTQIVEMMETHGVIKRDGSWQNNNISQGYRFTDHYLGSPRRWISVTYQPFLKLAENANLTSKRFKYEKRVVAALEGWFKTGELKIDYNEAKGILDRVKSDEFSNSKRGKDSLRINATYHSRLAAVERINEKCSGIHQDEFGYRVHTPLTQLKSEFRCLVRYNNEELVQVDIKNSQLYFMLYLLDWRNWKKTKNTKMIWKDIETDIKHNNSNTTTIMFLKSLESTYGKGLQSHTFVSDCSNGRLYEAVMKMVNADNQPPVDRDYVKKTLVGQLFCNPTTDWTYFTGKPQRVWTAFEALYPDVSSIIEDIKAVDHKNMSKLLQRIEATAMLKYVCRTLRDNHSDAPVFTLHDCIVTTQAHALLVEQVMFQHIGGFIGIQPTVELTPWSAYRDRLDAFGTSVAA